MCSTGIIRDYLRAGKVLTPLNGKIPKLKNWTERIVEDEKLLSYNGNLGWVIGPGDLVIDVDPRNGGDESFALLTRWLKDQGEEALLPTVVTPSGGFHVYLKVDDREGTRSFHKTLKKYPGVDFLTTGAQCVIADSSIGQNKYSWYDDMLGGFEQTDAPQVLVDLITRAGSLHDNSSNVSDEDLGDFEGMLGGNSATWSTDKVRNLLDKLDPSVGNDEWVKIGMALNDWDPILGLELWEEWSKGGDNYTAGETEKRARSFTVGGGVSLGTLYYKAKEVDFDDGLQVIEGFVDRINKADEKAIKLNVCPDIRKKSLEVIDEDGRERLAVCVQARLKDLMDGARLPISRCREMVACFGGGEVLARGEAPDWCNQWVYINSHRGYVDFTKLLVHKSDAFNLINTKKVPPGPQGGAMSATNYAQLTGYIKVVDSMAYLPMQEKRLCTINGSSVLNTFNSRTVPEVAEFTEDGLAAIEMVKKHIKFIATTHEASSILTQWIAHQVQYPGQQILWSPLIQSIPGVGKSFFAELLRQVLGDRNIGTVSPTQVTSDFNGWATNVVVNVLEELRVQGHNRYEAVNALKPLITDRIIQINEKGVQPYSTLNTANYICFTNAKDALPLDQNDRRWWIIFVPIQHLDDLPKFVDQAVEDYFPPLFEAVRTFGGELRRWLLELDITPEFKNIKQAPMTEYKQMMVATEEAGTEGLSEVREMLEKGSEFYNKECVSTSDLFSDLMFDYPELDIKTSKQAIIMKRLGFQKITSPVNINGKARRFWVKRLMSPKEIRESLE
jgi:hypothetical protein